MSEYRVHMQDGGLPLEVTMNEYTPGERGRDGKSAYELAVVNGFSGSESEWLASLKGERGDKGDKGDTGASGLQGEKGDKGDTGTPGLQGEKGDKGDTGAPGQQGDKGDKGDIGAPGQQGDKGDKGDIGAPGQQGEKGDKGDTGAPGLQGEKGDKGDTGASGQQGEKGEKGDKGETGKPGADGKSAYEIAVDNGFSGTEQEWLESLKGKDGSGSGSGTGDYSVLENKPAINGVTLEGNKTAGELLLTDYFLYNIKGVTSEALFSFWSNSEAWFANGDVMAPSDILGFTIPDDWIVEDIILSKTTAVDDEGTINYEKLKLSDINGYMQSAQLGSMYKKFTKFRQSDFEQTGFEVYTFATMIFEYANASEEFVNQFTGYDIALVIRKSYAVQDVVINF